MDCITAVLLILLAVSVMMDFQFDKIRNWWVLFALITGMSHAAWQNGAQGMAQALLTMAVPVILLYPFFMIGGLGAGDIKLLAVTGCFLPRGDMLKCLAVSFLIGAVFSLLKMAVEHNFLQRMQYLMSYIHDVFKSGKWELYAEDARDGRQRKKDKIHFALPVFISVALWAGGFY